MKLRKILSGFICSAMLISSAVSGFSASVSAVEVKNGSFIDLSQTQIVKEMGAGWNLGNQLEASWNGTPNETQWNNPTITKQLIQAVKAQGFKTIRIPVSWLNKIGSAPNYTIDSAWLNRVKEVVDYCIDEGLYATINMHGDGYNTVDGGWLLCNKPESEQVEIRNKYKACWQQIAAKFKDYDEHLIFEAMNEEFDGTYSGNPNRTYYENINKYNQIFVDTVRQTGGNNAKRWLLITGWNTDISYTVGDYGFSLPTDTYRDSSISDGEKRIMISVHYYSPWGFCGSENGNETQWGNIAADSSKKDTWGQEDFLESQFKSCYDKFVSKGYPVIIGEYGSIDKTEYDSTSNTYRAYFAKKVCETAKKYGCVPIYWDNGYNGKHGFGLFNRYSNTVTQQGIIDAIMSVYAVNEDKEALNETILSAEALNEKDYTADTWSSLKTALANAKTVFNSSSSTNNDYVTANSNLKTAIDNLVVNPTEPSSENPTEPSSENPTEPSSENPTEPSSANPTEPSSENPTEPSSENPTEPSSENPTESSSDNPTGSSQPSSNKTEPITKATAKATAVPAKVTAKTTRNASVVKKDRSAALKAMKQAKITKLKVKSKSKKKINVTWKKVKKAKGYQIEVSTNKKFKRNKIIFNKELVKTKLTVKNKKIKSKKTYYVRVRAYAVYKDINGRNQKVYSKWNKVLRKVKVK